MEHHDQNAFWDKFFDTDSQSGTGRFVAIVAVFVVLGGGISWLLS
ncbi:MAG: hypothetical protein V7774_07030 [Pseudorhizobium pelagicum]|jgi:hypothetical protein|nr:hypothetical protein [Pseudomonadota bacterium]|tara:strand:- start:477 stop:611 length:135 start_codon:yes stop_codon:yes gene_type:complete